MVAGWGAVVTAREAWRRVWRLFRDPFGDASGLDIDDYRWMLARAYEVMNARDEVYERAPRPTDSLDLRISVRWWDTWGTPVGHDRRPRYMRGGPL